MFKIYDGREQFFQWDLEQKLIVSDPTVNEVHFSHQVDSESLVCEVYELDGLRVVNVPNILLQEDWKINVYAYCSNYTKISACFKVIPKAKPADYIYTETEVKTYEKYEERLAALEENGDGIREITEETYMTDLEPGIYKINATDDSYGIYMDDCYWICLYEGIVSFSYSEYDNMYSWFYVGRDMTNGTTAHFGKTYWNGEFWLCEDYRDVYNQLESNTNRINDFKKASYANYPSAKAVVDYVEDKGKWELLQSSDDVEIRKITQTHDGTYTRYVVLLEGIAKTASVAWNLFQKDNMNASLYQSATIGTHAYGSGAYFFLECPKNAPTLVFRGGGSTSGNNGVGTLKQTFLTNFNEVIRGGFMLVPNDSSIEYTKLSVKIWGVKA